MKVKLDMSRDEIVKKISNLMIRLYSYKICFQNKGDTIFFGLYYH